MLPQAPARMTVHWLWKAIYILILVFFVGLALLAVVKGQYGPALIFLGCSVLTVLAMIATRSYVEVDRNRVLIYGPPFGKYMIRWDEISRVETNGVGYVFRGNDKALGFNSMTGHRATDVRNEIDAQVTRRGIEFKRVRQTPTVMPKNTRMT